MIGVGFGGRLLVMCRFSRMVLDVLADLRYFGESESDA